MAASSSLCFLRLSPFSPPPLRFSNGLRPSRSPTAISLHSRLSSFAAVSGSPLLLPAGPFPATYASSSGRLAAFTVFASKGYKMKTHKASAKRFRVTGRGKIVRRRARKQHLLGKKNTKRKLRLSKMHPVNRSDYDNVIGALPYLKVNRNAT
ncbi:large ribosomal subunit protein bL35c [Curcuma longa]|uniref:large ribosomal subunit protein bL35c n=1 Tax=Curcuma longa TaxID=136217 RepID=UPI003D9E6131